jgi:hypothetical protein
MKTCPQGHEIFGENAKAFINNKGMIDFRCRICAVEAVRKFNEKKPKATGSGQFGRQYIPEWKELKRDPFDFMRRCEETR